MSQSIDLGWGIHLIDTQFQRKDMAACYLMVQGDEIALIETGTKDTVPLIFDCLKSLNLDPQNIKYIIPTHVHLDHAGGVGLLMQQLPNATLVVHEKGARHMIDPSKLQAGATAVYGKAEFDKTYGDLLPVAADRVISPAHGECLTIAGRELKFLDSPGHARHHFCIYDGQSQGFFTGDTFGLAYQELTNSNGPFIFPTTTPVQFDDAALKHSINMLMDYKPQRMFLTHYGMVENVQVLGESLLVQVDELTAMAKTIAQHAAPGTDEYVNKLAQVLSEHFLNRLEQHGCELSKGEQLSILKPDLILNAQGLSVWLS